MILALDLSTTRTGWAKYNVQGELLDMGQITPPADLHPYLKIKFVDEKLYALSMDAEFLVVEGIFLNTFAGNKHNVTGFELLARLSGVIINSWLRRSMNIPTLYKATEARPLVGLKGSCQKAEVQLWVIKNFQLDHLKEIPELNEFIEDMEALIDAAYAEKGTKTISPAVFKSRMEKINHLIEDETDIGEDLADAILLGKAYCNGQHNKSCEGVDNT
jgi:hypothetical protein